jgi:single-strand DNA-binding protein
MYSIKNKVQLIGNLGNPPEIKTMENGKKWARFSVATDESYTTALGDKVRETQWHSLIAWGKTADFVEKYLDKGTGVIIVGKLVHRDYNDKEGKKRYVTEVEANEVLLMGAKEKEKV